MNRGDRREPIFVDDEDRQLFLKILGETCEKTGWVVHALCRINNHFHLVAETPRANLVDASTERRGDKSADRSVSENENYNDRAVDCTAFGNGALENRRQRRPQGNCEFPDRTRLSPVSSISLAQA